MIFWGTLLFFAALSVGFVALLYRSYRVGADLREFLPSFAWLALMLAPFCFQSMSLLTEQSKSAFYLQAFGIGLFFVSFAVSDFFSLKPSRARDSRTLVSSIQIPLGIMLVSFLAWIVHVYQMPQIPLLEKLIHPYVDKSTFDLMRERSSKLLDMPMWFIYLCQILLLISPVQIIFFFRKKKVALGVFSLLFVLFYSRITLAKGPLYLILFTFIVVYWREMLALVRRRRLYLIPSLVAAFVFYMLVVDPLSPIFGKVESVERMSELEGLAKESRLTFTPADRYRVFLREKLYNTAPRWRTFVGDFYYRAFLVPSEVSSRWYNYYPELNGGKPLGFYGLTPASRNLPDFQHPATTVGVWAYYDRFPAQYLPSIRAYCSVDCDAYARWGIWGLVMGAFLVGGLRWFLARLRVHDFYFDQYYFVGLTTFSLSILAASIQAILVAQGLSIFLLALLVGVVISKMRSKTPMHAPVEQPT